MKKKTLLVLSVLFVVFLLVGCKPEGEDPADGHTVTFKYGDVVLREVQVEDGETVTRPTDLETKEDLTFVNWYAVPTLAQTFNFNLKITQNTTVFAGFAHDAVDTSNYYLVGSGKGPLLQLSNWGKVWEAEPLKMTKDADENIYEFTFSAYENDEFQFAITGSGSAGGDWQHKHGYGYLQNPGDAFTGAGGTIAGDVQAKGMNIRVMEDGKYTFKLHTFPHADDGFYWTTASDYTEAQKESFKYYYFDYITWERIGEAEELAESVENLYIYGAGITGWTYVHSPATKFVNVLGVYTLDIYLKAGETFGLTSFMQDLETGVESTTQLKWLAMANVNPDDASLFANPTGNFVTNAAGLYKFSVDLNVTPIVVNVEFDGSAEVPDYMHGLDFYLFGVFGGSSWKIEAANLLVRDGETDIYILENVELEAGDEIIVQSMVKGLSDIIKPEDYKTAYQYPSLTPSAAFGVASATNANIKVITGGAYTVKFDVYMRVITIVPYGAADQVYIKGDTVNGQTAWAHNFSTDYLLVQHEDTDLFMIEIEFTGAGGFGLERYPAGTDSGNGTFIGRPEIGAIDGITATPVDLGESGNPNISAAGTYFVVYDMVNNIFNVYSTNPFA